MNTRFFIKYWPPVLLWMIFIFVGSTDLLSAEHTSRFIGPFLRWFAPDIAGATIASVQLVVRKCAHLTEYAILAALLCRALRLGHNNFRRAGALSLVVAALYAVFDEFHQSFVPSRTGAAQDVAIDCCGAIFGLLIYSVWARRKHSEVLSDNRNSPI
jgi:VanZ family protein